MDFEACL